MKKCLLLFVVLVSMFVFAACNSGNVVDENFELITEAQLREYNGTTEIKFVVPSGIIATNLEPLIKEFEAQWAGKIKVNFVKSSEGYDGVRTQTIMDLNNNKAPSMLIGYPDHFAEYYTGDGLLNLQPYIDAEGAGFLDDFVDAYLPENRIADGKSDMYGLPLNKSTEVLVYNKTIFDAMGYTVPTTWAELETLSAKILKDVADKKLDDLKINKLSAGEVLPSAYLEQGRFYPFAYDSGANAFITMARQWGGAYTEKQSIRQGYAMFNNQKVKEGLAYFKGLNQSNCFAIAETFDQSYASTAFQNIQCIMTIGSSAGIGYNIKSGADVYEVGVAPILVKDQNAKYVIQQGTNIAILNQNTNYQRGAAWQLIKFLTSTNNTVTFAIGAGGYFPVRKSGYETDQYKAFLAMTDTLIPLKNAQGEPVLDDDGEPIINPNPTYHFSRSAAVGLSYTEKSYILFTDPFFNGSSKIRTEVGSLFANIIVNSADVNIDTAINNTLATLGPKFQKK